MQHGRIADGEVTGLHVVQPRLLEVDLDRSTLDWLTDRIVDALARDERVGAPALMFLLCRLSSVPATPGTSGSSLAEPLGTALARELGEPAHSRRNDDRSAWMTVFGQAAALSDDPRLGAAAAELLVVVRSLWHGSGSVDDSMRSVEACLLSVDAVEAREVVADAIDELERVVAHAYRPGEGMAHEIGAPQFVRGSLSDQIRSASALLTAYLITGRLPYSMLAEELMQCELRRSWTEHAGFQDLLPAGGSNAFALNCEAARVFCRLAVLHDDEEYRKAAVIASGTDYSRTAARALGSQAASVRERGVEAAPFGLALADWLQIR